ncbi:non-canonical purine NTP pyrophosphatase, RdgB/HAM1 family [Fructilactobacillus lindneri]|uniref:dITP/XTP pyrophosphatase n=2 Tax=Fructilactobacillus lindneri TaxID=53444 RepID=A0A0R2JPU9_9LACO|nr:XTP/dITP diphosphatase [Fructilactobacillus lindneri]ANZ58321.1 non-canonical purine NTP pyrophosphatase [Fructilactobacillus lindneri]ANZ59643.1 non-canonical purine NTP pyrophosphatase [Fructilactobacillus lindneri]KRN79154.1 nucleoside-triphosphatase [Fructilactobacillus lindneri DSM 20690 = JCM 11027]POG98573.1 non-canonical purine NTP pyrophosphatase, RdgB/HAM1 family [Fructilactobacillus lindneri]POH03961.1 non-canonical purine NTP pyrophosphatase, RdgB/HAM1 family [Fructilactobacillu
MKSKELVIASKNQNKIREFKEMLEPMGFQIKSIQDFNDIPDINETGKSFEENATIKARIVSKSLNIPVLADNSGLVVPSINGEPGIYSARYAGDHDDQANNEKLLKRLLHSDDRNAYFHTSLVLMKPNGEKLHVTGIISGEILKTPKGNNGFGYDPLFFVVGKEKTLAEMTDSEKNEISHRGRALAKLSGVINDWW